MIGFVDSPKELVDSPKELQAAMVCVIKKVLNPARFFARSTMLEMSNLSYKFCCPCESVNRRTSDLQLPESASTL